uniref:URB2 ribosome biogenesis homolog n=1 Tax=Takifugu rubripes TaxID=31033 RepID=A0A3B5KEU3_TAKRU
MAAMYSGIHLKLKGPHTPWEDKLKLARFAWISTQCLLPNKEQVLLDWCTHALTGCKKLHLLLKQGKTINLRLNMAQLLLERLSEEERIGSKSPVCLSTILSVCQGLLSSPALLSVFTTKYELMVTLVATLCSLCCRKLQQPVDDMMLECLQNPLDTDLDTLRTEPTMENSSDQQGFDESVCPTNPKKALQSANLFDILLQALSCYLSVQRQQANPNRVFMMVTNQLLQILVLLRHLLASGEFGPRHMRLHQDLCRDIRSKIDSILKLSLFPTDHLIAYKEELLPSKSDSVKCSGGAKGSFKPVNAILSKLCTRDYCEEPLHYAVKSTTLSLLFKFFLESYRSGGGKYEEEHCMLCFHFLTRLVLDTGLDGHKLALEKVDEPIALSSGENCPLVLPESWRLTLLAVESLLNQALSADIYNIAADKIRHEEVQLKFYRSIGQMLFNQAQPSIPAWYHCLKVLMSLNHLIVEPDLDKLLSTSWVNSECVAAHVQKAREDMICRLLQIYMKLRQLPRLFSEIGSVICQPALDHLRPPLLSEIFFSIRTCLLDIPSSQGLEICSVILETIRKNVLPDLVKDKREVEDMVIDSERGDKEMMQDQDKNNASLKLFSLSQLLHVILFNLKTLDNTSPLSIVRQGQGLMEDIQQLVRELILVLPLETKAANTSMSSIQKTTKKGKRKLEQKDTGTTDCKVEALWVQKTQEAALLLQYTWVEVNMFFLIRCSKYTSLDEGPSGSKNGAGVPFSNNLESFTSLQLTCSPMSCLLNKLIILQQMKKVLLDTASVCEPSTAALLHSTAHSILAETQFMLSLDEEQVWNRHIVSVESNSYFVAHWYIIVSNLPLIVPHLNGEDVGCIADALVSSLLSKKRAEDKDCLSGYLTTSLIFSQLLQSSLLAELPTLFSATVHSLNRGIISILKEARVTKVNQMLFEFPEKEGKSLKKESQSCSKLFEKEALVQEILASLKIGKVTAFLNNEQSNKLIDFLNIVTHLNPDGMNSEDISSIFLLLLFVLTSTSVTPECGDDSVALVKLLRAMICLVEGRSFQTILKHIHGGTLLQAVVTCLFWHSDNGRFQTMCGSHWLDIISATQDLITCLLQVIINRNSSVRLNLDQFNCYLISKEMARREDVTPGSVVTSDVELGRSRCSDHLLLASLASLSQAVVSHLGRSKSMDKTLAQILMKTTASLGQAVKSVLKPKTGSQSGNQPASILSQAYIVEVVTIMLRCELSSLSVEEENEQSHINLSHMILYQGFYHQIIKEICSAQRPMEFLVSSLHFLSLFYQVMKKTGEKMKRDKELDEVYVHILQTVHRLMSASWLSSTNLCELEAAVQELLCHLVEESTSDQFNLLLLMIREALNASHWRVDNYRNVLSAVIIIKLLSCCQLPELCSKAWWLLAPQIISALMLFITWSSQDPSLILPFTVPTVMSVTLLLRRGEGLLTSPHYVTMVLGALQSVALDHLSPLVYHSVFLAVHEALFAIIQCHPQVMLKAAPSFLNVFYRLVVSIMQEGRQQGERHTGPDSHVYLECSRLVERMYSHIAATAESFTTLSSFMVAQYVTELQKVTLRTDIKLHLTEGIYRILDLCVEQDIKFLAAGLQLGVREVFNELYSSYTVYHKAQRQGEDKYTV